MPWLPGIFSRFHGPGMTSMSSTSFLSDSARGTVTVTMPLGLLTVASWMRPARSKSTLPGAGGFDGPRRCSPPSPRA